MKNQKMNSEKLDLKKKVISSLKSVKGGYDPKFAPHSCNNSRPWDYDTAC